MKTPKKILTSLFLLGATTTSYAALVVNETFDYPGSGEVSVVPSPWEDGTSNVVYRADVTAGWSGDSDYTLSGAGGSLHTKGLSNYRGGQLDLGTSLTGTFWTSVLIRTDAAASSEAGALVAFENGSYFYSNFDGFAFGINGNGNLMTASNSGSSTAEDIGVGLPSGFGLYIAKITVNGGGANDAIDLWAFGSGDSFGQTEASLGSTVFSSSSIQYGDSISDVWLGGQFENGGVSSAPSYFDNLRISDQSGNTGLAEVLSGSVIPEPSSILLLSMGLLLAVGSSFRTKR